MWNSRIRPVSSVEEVRASSIDFDGSIFYFPDLANNKIYTKQINMDGTSSILMYELKDLPQKSEMMPDMSNFVTRQELEEMLKGLREKAAPAKPIDETAQAAIPMPNIQF